MNKNVIINFIYTFDNFFKNASINYRNMMQIGGTSIKMDYNGEKFIFDNNIDDNVYFMRTIDEQEDCIILSINKKSKTVNINNINADTVQPCFQKITNKKGTFLLEIAIKFAKKLKKERIIDVTMITLTDNSKKHCLVKDHKSVIFSDLRQIISGDTFYGKHGFVPVYEEDKDKYKKNKTVLSRLSIKDINFEKYINKYNKDGMKINKQSLDRLLTFIKDNQNMKISKFFDILSDNESFENNCGLIDFLIKKIYRKYDLDSMYGIVYEMML